MRSKKLSIRCPAEPSSICIIETWSLATEFWDVLPNSFILNIICPAVCGGRRVGRKPGGLHEVQARNRYFTCLLAPRAGCSPLKTRSNKLHARQPHPAGTAPTGAFGQGRRRR